MLSDLVEECISVVDESIMYENGSDIVNLPSRMPYIVLFVVFLLASGIISGIFVYYYRNEVKKDYVTVNYSMAGKIDY